MKKGIVKPALSLMAGIVSFAVPFMAQAALSLPADMTEVFQVEGLSAGNVLKMYDQPGSEGVIVNIPHNAKWVVRRNAQVKAGNTLWEKISWGDRQTGWVDSNALALDPESTKIARDHRACVADPAVKLKECCGYPDAGKGTFHSVPLFKVRGKAAGESLMMYVDKGSDAIAVEIPHNAVWIAKLGKRAEAGKSSWELVRWAGQNGWVNANDLEFDAAGTKEGDRKREVCGGSSAGVDSKKSDVVCLPAPVIRRLQEAGALDADTINKLKSQAK